MPLQVQSELASTTAVQASFRYNGTAQTLQLNVTHAGGPLLLLSLASVEAKLATTLQLTPVDAAWATAAAVSLSATLHMQNGLQQADISVAGNMTAGNISAAIGLYGVIPDDFFTARDVVVRYSSSPDVNLQLELQLDLPVLLVQGKQAVLTVMAGKAAQLQVGIWAIYATSALPCQICSRSLGTEISCERHTHMPLEAWSQQPGYISTEPPSVEGSAAAAAMRHVVRTHHQHHHTRSNTANTAS
jgi:hypothetical protein